MRRRRSDNFQNFVQDRRGRILKTFRGATQLLKFLGATGGSNKNGHVPLNLLCSTLEVHNWESHELKSPCLKLASSGGDSGQLGSNESNEMKISMVSRI